MFAHDWSQFFCRQPLTYGILEMGLQAPPRRIYHAVRTWGFMKNEATLYITDGCNAQFPHLQLVVRYLVLFIVLVQIVRNFVEMP